MYSFTAQLVAGEKTSHRGLSLLTGMDPNNENRENEGLVASALIFYKWSIVIEI